MIFHVTCGQYTALCDIMLNPNLKLKENKNKNKIKFIICNSDNWLYVSLDLLFLVDNLLQSA